MKACELPGNSEAKGKVLTRIYIEKDGDLVVTDLWEELKFNVLSAMKGFEEKEEAFE